MSDQPTNETYGMDPHDAATPESAAPEESASSSPAPRKGLPMDLPRASSASGSPPPLTPRNDPVPLEPTEDEVPMAMRPVKDLDVCPNCGAAMRDIGEVVCLRCGFDLKTMKKVQTATGVVEVEPEQEGKVADESQPVRKPIVKSGRGDTRLPLIMAAAAGAILLIGYLAGAHGLFPPVVNANNEVVPGADIAFGQRMLGLLRFVISDAMWTLCALGGLVFLAFLLSMRLGDGILAAARMLGIITVAHLATFINFSSNALEFIVESIIEAGIFVGLSIVLFNLKPKDTPTLLGSTIMLFMILWLGAKTVVAILG